MAEVLKAFPCSDYEALALLYVQNQDIKGLTPEQLTELYLHTVNRILKHKHAVISEINESYR